MASPTSGMGMAENAYQNDTRRRRKKDGWFTGKITWACYILFLIQVGVFIGEIVRNSVLTGSPIEIHPSFNPMIGPSPYVLINVGARYVPCMRSINAEVKDSNGTLLQEIPAESPDVPMPCPNTTTTDAKCLLADICGFGMGKPSSSGKTVTPNQWWRFITPIFLHGGIIHIGFNMFLQLTLGRDIEKEIGTLRFLLIYFSAGIFGFVFGGNFAPNGIPSTGCSGSLFGIIALTLLDLLYTWKNRKSPGRDLLFIGLDVVISFVLGLLPGLDNFSHIGGFLVGLMLGVCLMRSPDALRERIGLDDAKYATVPHVNRDGDEVLDQKNPQEELRSFAKQPAGFFKGRKPLWWAWWGLRVMALVLFVVVFAVLINNFYKYQKKCTWCKYLSCLVSFLLLDRNMN
jgi:membrane associated rhomboid family serine protease